MSIYIADTRNQVDNFITTYLKRKGHTVIRSKMAYGDIALFNDQTRAIDIKQSKGLLELASNLCSKQHERIRREIDLCAKCGGELIFLVCPDEPYIKCIDDVAKWKSPCYKSGAKRGQPYTRITGTTLMKTMRTMESTDKYGCKVSFVFTSREKAGAKVIELLEGANNG